MHTAISPGGAVGTPTPVLSGWAGLDDAALVASCGKLLAFFPGERTTNTTEPFFGLDLATSTDSGASWSLYGSGSIYNPGQCCNLNQNVASEGGGVWVAWCSQNDAPAGRWVQAIDPGTGH